MLDQIIKLALKEDIGEADHSTLACVPRAAIGSAHLLIKENGVLAGIDVAKRIYEIYDPSLEITYLKKDGDKVTKGEIAFVSEKSYAGSSAGVYTFEVHPSASKPEIRDAVQRIFNVQVVKVNTLNRPGKRRITRGTNRVGVRDGSKRAIVTLAPGQQIPLFEN